MSLLGAYSALHFLHADGISFGYPLDSQSFGSVDFPYLVDHTVKAALIENCRFNKRSLATLLTALFKPLFEIGSDLAMHYFVKTPELFRIGKNNFGKLRAIDIPLSINYYFTNFQT